MLTFWRLSAAKVCKSCRSRQGLSNEYLFIRIRFDTAENEPPEVWRRFYSCFQFTPYIGIRLVEYLDNSFDYVEWQSRTRRWRLPTGIEGWGAAEGRRHKRGIAAMPSCRNPMGCINELLDVWRFGGSHSLEDDREFPGTRELRLEGSGLSPARSETSERRIVRSYSKQKHLVWGVTVASALASRVVGVQYFLFLFLFRVPVSIWHICSIICKKKSFCPLWTYFHCCLFPSGSSIQCTYEADESDHSAAMKSDWFGSFVAPPSTVSTATS